jgi:branched-chain amino acid transport system substrate-binding protein
MLSFPAIVPSGCRKSPEPDGKPQLHIASILPATGAAAELGPYHRNACELFVSAYNQKPDAKFHLSYSFQDSQSTPKGGVNAAQALLAQRESQIFVVHQGSVVMAVTPILAKNDALLLYVGATEEPKSIMPTAFRIYPDPLLISRITVKGLLPDPSAARLAVIVANDDFGVTVANAVREELALVQTQPIVEERYDPAAADFRPLITRVLGRSPTAIYLVGVGNPLGRLVTQIRQLGFQGDILGAPEMQFTDFLTSAGPAAEGAKFFDIAYDAQSTDEPTATFVREYVRAYGKPPTAASAIIYDGLLLLLHAAEKANSTDPSMIAYQMTQTETFAGVCGTLQLDDRRDVVFPVKPKTIRNGKVEPVETMN